jgi:hypothetical protein
VPNSYVHIEEFKSALGITDDVGIDNLDRALDAAAGWVESYCGRRFTIDAADVTRYFYADNPDELLLGDDLRTVTSLAIDSNGDLTYDWLLTTTDYELLPLDGPPYDRIRIWPASSIWFAERRRIRLVGKFGYVPTALESANLRQAIILLATRYYKRHEAPFGILSATDLGQFERISKEDPDVIALLTPLVRSGTTSTWVLV